MVAVPDYSRLLAADRLSWSPSCGRSPKAYEAGSYGLSHGSHPSVIATSWEKGDSDALAVYHLRDYPCRTRDQHCQT